MNGRVPPGWGSRKRGVLSAGGDRVGAGDGCRIHKFLTAQCGVLLVRTQQMRTLVCAIMGTHDSHADRAARRRGIAWRLECMLSDSPFTRPAGHHIDRHCRQRTHLNAGNLTLVKRLHVRTAGGDLRAPHCRRLPSRSGVNGFA
jgi:hypothetical protein